MLAALVLAAVIDCDAYASYEIPQPYEENADAVELAERFANGNGVTRDVGAAIHLVCNADDLSQDERDGMLDHLQKMLDGETTEALDFCNFVNGGHGAYVCAVRNDRSSEAAMRSWFSSQPPSKPLDALRERAVAYIEEEALAQAEANRGGTVHEMMVIANRFDARDQFVALLDRLSKERARAECEGSAAASQTRAWLAYRDAFVTWYVARWHGAAPDSVLRREVRALLTCERARSAGTLASPDASGS